MTFVAQKRGRTQQLPTMLGVLAPVLVEVYKRKQLKINSTRHQHDTQRGIVAVESCFAVFVAHQCGVTDGESVGYAVLMSHKPALFWCFFGVVLMSCKINQLCRIRCVYFVYFC